MKLGEHPQTLKDLVLGYMGATISAIATIVDVVPYVIGLGISFYALYNQHMLAKINRKKLEKLDNEDN